MAKKLEHVNLWDAAGMFLVAEGALSIALSTDQRPISNFSRLVRIIIGIAVAVYEK